MELLDMEQGCKPEISTNAENTQSLKSRLCQIYHTDRPKPSTPVYLQLPIGAEPESKRKQAELASEPELVSLRLSLQSFNTSGPPSGILLQLKRNRYTSEESSYQVNRGCARGHCGCTALEKYAYIITYGPGFLQRAVLITEAQSGGGNGATQEKLIKALPRN
ncbi:unnamed protein product [Tetraodon nigroviridis]|uniref:(spotted green pufferfish) hypothetical protein n=1 Tax=Tetraodon nigroviridis TaxID=99883 RepID=Q4RM89_TETNG|nr:unnamed protein product [Tetraodon nigroviridis]